MAKDVRPDIAIIDYSIPELNGLDLSHALKRQNPRIEILLYTMHDREEIVMDVLRAGVRGFVLKSDTEKHLLAALDALAIHRPYFCLLYTSDAADERSSVDLGGRRIIKKKKKENI